jgi:RimJ/RimL family protein N-acetyltransferase
MNYHTLETERLILRPLTPADFGAVHSWASNPDNTRYMPWGPNTEEQTQGFLASVKPGTDFAVVLRESYAVIGSCGIYADPARDTSELGWILHMDHWKRGYGTEIGKELIRYGFEDLKLRRIYSTCAAVNYGSYQIMERGGMRREALHIKNIWARVDKEWIDQAVYAILADEYYAVKEIAYYNSLPCVFDDFIEVPELSDNVIRLVCTAKTPANPEKKWVPAYSFAVCKGGEQVGEINLRIGYVDRLYYGGQIGYSIKEKYRGNGYAGRACQLLRPVARAHGMEKLLITNDHANAASMRVCEKLGCRLLRTARLPEWHDLYKEGRRFSNIYEWDLERGI